MGILSNEVVFWMNKCCVNLVLSQSTPKNADGSLSMLLYNSSLGESVLFI